MLALSEGASSGSFWLIEAINELIAELEDPSRNLFLFLCFG